VTDPRFLLDENVDPLLREALRHRESAVVVWSTGDPGAPPLGTKDPEIPDWCEAYEFMLVTHNRRSMPVHLADHLSAGKHVPGVFVVDQRLPLGQIVEALLLIWAAASPNEFADRLGYLPGDL